MKLLKNCFTCEFAEAPTLHADGINPLQIKCTLDMGVDDMCPSDGVWVAAGCGWQPADWVKTEQE